MIIYLSTSARFVTIAYTPSKPTRYVYMFSSMHLIQTISHSCKKCIIDQIINETPCLLILCPIFICLVRFWQNNFMYTTKIFSFSVPFFNCLAPRILVQFLCTRESIGVALVRASLDWHLKVLFTQYKKLYTLLSANQKKEKIPSWLVMILYSQLTINVTQKP